MKITGIEFPRMAESANVLHLRGQTNARKTGLSETFYGAAALKPHSHDTLAVRLLGRNPPHIETL